MFSEIKSVIWKEYKETRSIGLVVLGFVLIASLVIIALSYFGIYLFERNLEFNRNLTFTVYLGITLAYVMVISATSLTKELEKDRLTTIRRFAISPRALFLGKIAWTIISALLLLVAFSLFWGGLLAVGCVAVDPLTKPLVSSFLLISLEIGVWGFFWSSRLRSSNTAIILTFLCGFLLTPLIFLIVNYSLLVYGKNPYDFQADSGWFTQQKFLLLRLAISITLAFFIYRRMKRWLDVADNRPKSKRSAVDGHAVLSFDSSFATTPLRMLTLYGLRRSRIALGSLISISLLSGLLTLFYLLFTAYHYPTIVFFQVLLNLKELHLHHFLGSDVIYSLLSHLPSFIPLVTIAFTVLMVYIVSNLFEPQEMGDNREIFTRLGITPFQYWWSRFAPFGLFLLVCVVIQTFAFNYCYGKTFIQTLYNLCFVLFGFLTFFSIGAVVSALTSNLLVAFLINILTVYLLGHLIISLNIHLTYQTLSFNNNLLGISSVFLLIFLNGLFWIPIVLAWSYGSYLLIRNRFFGQDSVSNKTLIPLKVSGGVLLWSGFILLLIKFVS